MQTLIVTSDNKLALIEHRQPIPECERKDIESMTMQRLYHVNWITGIRVEE